MRLLFGKAFGLNEAETHVTLIPVPERAVQISPFAAAALFLFVLVHVIKVTITLGHTVTSPNS